jgi:DNA-binding MarR family transcriptional regulator
VRYRSVRPSAQARPGQLSRREAAAWHGLLRAHARLVRDLDRSLREAHGLPLSWYEVLAELASAPEGRIRMGELAARVMLTPAGLSGVVDRLQRAKLIERRPCEGDARGTFAVATAEGLRRLRRAERTHRDTVRRHYTSRFDDSELELVGSMWERVAASGRRS